MDKKTIVIIGAGNGVSAAVAKKFGSEGFQIALIARNINKLSPLENELSKQSINFKSFKANAAIHNQLSATLREIMRHFGGIDVLHYNAAALRKEPILQDEVHLLEEDFKVNVTGAFNAVQTVLPTMQDKSFGTILFTGGGFANHPDPNFGSLGIGKAALKNLSSSLHLALVNQGIHVGIVTINGYVSESSPVHTPSAIAELFWKHHSERDKAEYQI